MAISFVGVQRVAEDWISGTTRSASTDAGTGVDRVLLAWVFTDRSGTTTIQSATYNGVSMTAATDVWEDVAAGREWRLFYLVNPASNSNTLSVTFGSVTPTKAGWVAAVYAGVDQTTPLNNIATGYGSVSNGNSYSAAQTTVSGDLAVFMAYTFDTSGSQTFYTPYGSTTERFDNYAFVADVTANSTSTTMGFTPAGTMSYSKVAFGMTPAGVTTTKTVTVTLVTSPTDATARANLTGLKWAFFDQATPDVFVAPVDKGTGETTDGSGVLSVTVTNSAKTNGQIGWLVVTDSDGTTAQSPAHKAFSGPVAVSVS